MMATALGQRFNAVRDVRRTFRAGLWLVVAMLPPYWLLLWHVGGLMHAFGISDELAVQGQTFLRAYMTPLGRDRRRLAARRHRLLRTR